MLEAYLVRDVRNNKHTLGAFIINGKRFDTIERAWLDNKTNVSCIPPGRYRCQYLARSASGKYKGVYHAQGVAGRTGILIHAGNLARHSKGCIILGKRRGFLGGLRAVLSSSVAIIQLARATRKQDFYLTVIGG